MKNDLYNMIDKMAEFLYFIWTCIADLFGFIATNDEVDNAALAIASPTKVLGFVLNDAPDTLFYYFFTNSFTLILFGLFLYFGLSRLMFSSHKYITRASIFLIMVFFKYIGASIIFSGGVIAMSGYFYPTGIVQYLGFVIAFTFCLPYIIIYLPFSYALGFKSFILKFTGDLLSEGMKGVSKYSNNLPQGIDANRYATGDLNANLRDGF